MVLQLFISFYLLISPAASWDEVLKGPSNTVDSLTVYVFLNDECKISQFYTPELGRLYDTYGSKKVGFVGYFPNPATDAGRMEAFARDYHLSFPLLEDYQKIQTRKFGITITPEVAVWDHRSNQQIYRGRIDDSYVRVGKRKTHPQHYDLKDIIESWLSHPDPQLLVRTQAIGCLVNFTD